ncbi:MULTISPECIES: hypothetical protein [unclassified Mesorhizobium]|uniref:hypothetical protein n=1 Tax=unclassified Mesorhizobium TaxID=325217 RepID=UPI00112BCC41|nr:MULTISPECIES: hypothetical protein [unclassified Mesorhizobium]TPJ36030.1 hypothetical protein FJ437_32635 [Mesorhizobium sp. B2-6-6]MBZ9999636.1 hypothetical protein [Mesorhizobium sp. B264B2A]MCA0008110.1 hypothetical protein [Mesorhizobium sp. B264B1B]MCA0018016.1 hypothetical protein [Mesorhizobium sp. B264B1A]TPJ53174.1 hypothetical protein FJ462_33260 [Mesorhizobium sp. B2-6-7]
MIAIKKIDRAHFEMNGSTIVATLDAQAGDFNIKQATLRQNHSDGTFFIGMGGGFKSRAGITLPRHCETRAALLAAAVEAYRNV